MLRKCKDHNEMKFMKFMKFMISGKKKKVHFYQIQNVLNKFPKSFALLT